MRFASHHTQKRVRSGGRAPGHALAPRRRFVEGLGGRCPGLEVRLLRSLILALALSCIVITSGPRGAAASLIHLDTPQIRAAAQSDERLAAAAATARELSMLEADRDFD